MSLINEALKKAQRQRMEPAAVPDTVDAGPGRPVAKRGKPMSAQTLILAVVGATVLIVFSVVFTVFFLNRDTSPPAPSSPTATTAKAPPASDPAAPSPVIAAPVIKPAELPAAPVERAPTSAAALPGVAAVSATAVNGSPTTLAAVPVDPTPAPGPTPASAGTTAANLGVAPVVSTAPTRSAQAQTFVDAIRVTGIRSSGADSKVLMNDRVYRVNDFVERSLGLKLVKVEPESLTFTDESGAVYTKHF